MEKAYSPEVLLLEEDDLLTENKMIAQLDLKQVTVKDLDLLGGKKFVSVCEKDGRFQGMAIWFEVEFPDGTVLSTGPDSETTHWKQIVLVLLEDIEVKQNEPIAYKLNLRRNMDFRRRYFLELVLLDTEEVEHDIPCNCFMTKCLVTKKYMDESDERESSSTAENSDSNKST